MAVLGFLMPPETGEKINMIITTLLSMGVYLQVKGHYLNDMLLVNNGIHPAHVGCRSIDRCESFQAQITRFTGMYYVASLFMVCLATMVNVVTLNIHRNGAANQVGG